MLIQPAARIIHRPIALGIRFYANLRQQQAQRQYNRGLNTNLGVALACAVLVGATAFVYVTTPFDKGKTVDKKPVE